MRSWRPLAEQVFRRAYEANTRNILRLAEPNPDAVFVDLGCGDGEITERVAAAIGTRAVHGLDLFEGRLDAARARGIEITLGDLNSRLPYEDGAFDAVCSNQTIEHLTETDSFVREIRRILKPGGYAVVSTENLASWHNVLALLLGWQPFSLSNVSERAAGLGNPLAIHRDEQSQDAAMAHLRVFAYRGLRELLALHGFSIEAVRGAGYYPLPSFVATLDPRHAAFLAVKARRSSA